MRQSSNKSDRPITRVITRQFRLAALLLALTTTILLLWMLWTGSPFGGRTAQAQPQDTPVTLIFPTFTATQGPPTETPTRTPTSEGRPYIEAISENTNLRAGPDINDPIVAKINPGRLYTVIGQRFDWYYIEFPQVPGGTAWVYSGVVTLTGDANLIVEYETLADVPETNPDAANAQATVQALTETPDLAITLTAQANITPTGVLAEGDAGANTPTLAPGQRLPTFTAPAQTPTPVIIPSSNPSTAVEDSGFPPLIPIMALGALGLMGLLVAFMRRL